MDGVPEEWFIKNCPNLYKQMMDNQNYYTFYGITIRSHTSLTAWFIIKRVEDCRAFIYYDFKWAYRADGCLERRFSNCLN